MRPERARTVTSGAAIAAVVVGIAGVVPGPLIVLLVRDLTRSYVPPIPPFVLPALALLLAQRATRQIAPSSGAIGGRRLARAGWVLGVVGTALSVLYVIACVAALSQT